VGARFPPADSELPTKSNSLRLPDSRTQQVHQRERQGTVLTGKRDSSEDRAIFERNKMRHHLLLFKYRSISPLRIHSCGVLKTPFCTSFAGRSVGVICTCLSLLYRVVGTATGGWRIGLSALVRLPYAAQDSPNSNITPCHTTVICNQN